MPARSIECVAPASPTTIRRKWLLCTGSGIVVKRLTAKNSAPTLVFLFALLLRGFFCRRLVLDRDDLAVHRIDVDFGDAGGGLDVERVNQLPAFVLQLRASPTTTSHVTSPSVAPAAGTIRLRLGAGSICRIAIVSKLSTSPAAR